MGIRRRDGRPFGVQQLPSTVGTSHASPGTAPPDSAGGGVRADHITIHLKFFARARDLAGCDSNVWSLPSATTVERLRERVSTAYPALASLAVHLLVAINGDYAADAMTLHEGDEAAFFPPVSGG